MEFNVKIIYNDGKIVFHHSDYYEMNTDFFEFSSFDDGYYYRINLDDIIRITISYHMVTTEFIVYQFYN